MFPFAYRLLTTCAHKLRLPLGKLSRTLAEQRSAAARWIDWAANNRTTDPLVWVHGASVGEGITALPVIARLRTAIPNVQMVHSFTSPSVVGWSAQLKTDRSDYLPSDSGKILGEVLDAVNPTLLACSRGDLWPEVAFASARRGIPVAIISGTVRPSSIRLRAPVRRLLRPVYETVSWLGAATADDAARWSLLGVDRNAITVTGDTRHDQVLERPIDLQRIRPLIEWSEGRTTLVAGSTYRSDEELLLRAFSTISDSRGEDARLIIVPHECSGPRVENVLATARRVGVEADEWDCGLPKRDTRCIVVSTMGLLADIYAAGQIAYVGGGFRRGGLHAVVEPAALATPVITGPLYRGSADACAAVHAGGAIALTPRAAGKHLKRVWLDWIAHPYTRVRTGIKARETLLQGAAQTTAKEIVRLLESARSV